MVYRSTQQARRDLLELAASQGGYFTAKQAAVAGYGKRHPGATQRDCQPCDRGGGRATRETRPSRRASIDKLTTFKGACFGWITNHGAQIHHPGCLPPSPRTSAQEHRRRTGRATHPLAAELPAPQNDWAAKLAALAAEVPPHFARNGTVMPTHVPDVPGG